MRRLGALRGALLGWRCWPPVAGSVPVLGIGWGWCWPGIAGGGLALSFFESFDAVDEVAVDGRAEGELDGGADERDSSGFDGAIGLDEFVHDADGCGDALLKHQGGVREGQLAELAQLFLEVVVLAEPAPQSALTDVGLARGGGDGARGEHGLDGAFLAGGESVSADVGATFVHIGLVLIFRLAGGGRAIRDGFL